MRFMKIKKLLLAIITVVSLIPVFLSLVNSVHQPQSQSNFQLYQTNLILKTSQIMIIKKLRVLVNIYQDSNHI